jgi:phosphatidylserine decarboxylase
VIGAALALALLLGAAFLYWRYVWFFRDPPRTPPALPGLVSPADGTVVYVRRVAPGEPVVSIKQGLAATIRDLVREDVDGTKLVIGIFMSPFDVHYNRAPLDGTVDFIRHHPARGENRHMGAMHWRILLGREPYYVDSEHIVQNERTVTRFVGAYRGAPLPTYVVQIGARTVNGIDSYFRPGEAVARGETFGMIRIGSQVDLVVPWRADFAVMVRPGEKVRAGETVLVR